MIFNMISLLLPVVREITDMRMGDYHLSTQYKQQLAMSSSPASYWYARLRLYSNRQMWAVFKTPYRCKHHSSREHCYDYWEKCVRIAGGNREQLQQLNGLKLELKSNEQGKYLLFLDCASLYNRALSTI